MKLCFFVCAALCLWPNVIHARIVINEIGAYERSESEWVEIVNTGDESVDLDGWKFFENGTKHSLSVFQGSSVLQAGEFAVIANKADVFISEKNFSGAVFDSSWSSLKEDGEEIALVDADGNDVERFTYVVADEFSLERTNPAINDYSGANWWQHVDGHTAGLENSNYLKKEPLPVLETYEEEDEDSDNVILQDSKRGSSNGKIIFNEVFPDSLGPDSDEEFIEIKNIGTTLIDLNLWEISDESRTFTIRGLHMGPGSLYVFKRSETKIALNNTGEKLTLKSWDGKTVDTLAIPKSQEGQSYSRDDDAIFSWSLKTTPLGNNIIEKPDEPPTAVIFAPREVNSGEAFVADSSDSLDPEGGSLLYFWEFGDDTTSDAKSPFHAYIEEGKKRILLRVTDTHGQSHEAHAEILVRKADTTTEVSDKKQDEDIAIHIQSFLPNPEGSDSEGEYIELSNPNDFDVDISGWSLDDGVGGSKPYIIPLGFIIPATQSRIFDREDTGISLNNTSDSVRLLREGKIVDEAYYQKTKEGIPHVRSIHGQWSTATVSDDGDFEDIAIDTSKAVVSGYVLSKPGVLGSQIMYVGDLEGGMQIYMHSKLWPELFEGDFIDVTGEKTLVRGEERLKIAGADDIMKINSDVALEAENMDIVEALNVSGGLVSVSGDVTEKKSSGFFLDDGSEEVFVSIKKSTLIQNDYEKGQKLLVTGIMTQSDSGLRLMPRKPGDIQILKILSEEYVEENVKPSSFFMNKKFFVIGFLVIAGCLFIYFLPRIFSIFSLRK